MNLLSYDAKWRMPIKDYLHPAVNGDIGVEVELEGVFNWNSYSKYSTLWDVKNEDSLRGGFEFTLKNPLPLPTFLSINGDVYNVFNDSIIRPSIRCSTHFHINVTDLTTEEIYNIIGYYYLVEDLLVWTQGKLRVGNLFCLRMSDAEHIGPSLVESIRGETLFHAFSLSDFKYGALNLGAPWKFGSLEFRFFRPMWKKAQLDFWAAALHRMVNKAKSISLKDSLDAANKGYAELLGLVFSTEQVESILKMFYENYPESNPVYLNELVTNNYYWINELRKAIASKKKYRFLPLDDLDTGKSNSGTIKFDWLGPVTTIPTNLVAGAHAHMVDDAEALLQAMQEDGIWGDEPDLDHI